MAYFYKAVVQAVLLFGSESCVLTQNMWKAVEGSHGSCASQMTGVHIRQRPNGKWILPSTARVLEQKRLRMVEEYIARKGDNWWLHEGRTHLCGLHDLDAASNAIQKVWWDSY